ncbi:MAG: ferrochelatase [Gammaproteobacteria bacterium]|nr:ferrochelatase [Gammaproteobacteria bacterium]
MVKYIGDSEYRHDSQPRAGILVVNLGTPDTPTRSGLRRYLSEFLSDPRVVELPRPLWWLILHGVILNVRPAKSAHAYQQVWTGRGSPLLDISLRQMEALTIELQTCFSGPFHVELGMRYGNPSIGSALEKLRYAQVRRLVVLPLYPQYSGSTVGSTFDAIATTLRRWRWVPELRFINAYHDHPGYIQALANKIRAHWEEHGRGKQLLLSFHGIPRRYLLAGDPYHCQCHKTARLIAESLRLEKDAWQLVFQSRFGREEWLRPYCDETLRSLPGHGITDVDIVCPGFSADCLETLEEIDQQNRAVFEQSGGHRLNYIPCLNDDPPHIELLAQLVADHTQGWPERSPDYDVERRAAARAAQLERARAMGAAQ